MKTLTVFSALNHSIALAQWVEIFPEMTLFSQDILIEVTTNLETRKPKICGFRSGQVHFKRGYIWGYGKKNENSKSNLTVSTNRNRPISFGFLNNELMNQKI